MVEVGLTEFKLANGRIVKIVEDCSTAITDATREQALNWLIAHDFGGLIKTSVAVVFGRGDRQAAQELGLELSGKHPDVAIVEAVHHSTLKSFVKEQIEAGNEIPMDLFNVYPYSKAVLK
jgi:hypothetical protein